MTVLTFPSPDTLVIRRYARGDGSETLRVFREAVRRGASSAYSYAELIAWAPPVIDAAGWIVTRNSRPTWVAERRGEVVGFSDLTADCEVDMLYVHPDHTRQGVGSALLEEVERCARAADMERLHTRASLVAEPVFARAGFVVSRRQVAERGGERLAQAVMEKILEPST